MKSDEMRKGKMRILMLVIRYEAGRREMWREEAMEEEKVVCVCARRGSCRYAHVTRTYKRQAADETELRASLVREEPKLADTTGHTERWKQSNAGQRRQLRAVSPRQHAALVSH